MISTAPAAQALPQQFHSPRPSGDRVPAPAVALSYGLGAELVTLTLQACSMLTLLSISRLLSPELHVRNGQGSVVSA